ncbi:MAG: hypothetical protein V8R81_06740 [Clostridia bacterium]
MKEIKEVLKYFPANIYNLINEAINQNEMVETELREIRIRANRPIILRLRNVDILIEYKVTSSEILQIVEKLCNNSIYAYKNQMCEGFITVRGGHRVGITGTAVIENGKIINLKYIASINFRIAREIIGCSKNILKEIVDIPNNSIFTTLLVSPPGYRKNNNAKRHNKKYK